jgi:uncharacterized damage-inducible protein DinB
MLEAISLMYEYNSWATDTLFKALAQLSDEEYTAPGCSGHGSIKDTLAHFLSVQWGWMSWFDGSLDVVKAISVKVDENDMASIAAARKKWESIEKQTEQFIGSLNEDILHEPRQIKSRDGVTSAPLLGELILHVANHGTHTRAQIVAAIRRAGHNPGIYELLRFLMEHRQVVA